MSDTTSQQSSPTLSTTTSSSSLTSSSTTTTTTTNTTWTMMIFDKIYTIIKEHEFLLLIILSIIEAKIYPEFGINYLYPQITATWIAVIIIFILAGLGLQTSELHNAALSNVQFNIFIQCYSFFVVSGLVYSVCRYIIYPYHIIQNTNLLDGIIICSCLPMAINTVIVLTKSSHGDNGAAVYNCAVANLIGILISPYLILYYLGIYGTMDPINILMKLGLRVLLPTFIGQQLQHISLVKTYILTKHQVLLKQLQQYCLAFIVYTVFCHIFVPNPNHSTSSSSTTTNRLSTMDVIIMIVCQVVLLVLLLIIAWILLGYLFPLQPKLRVMGVYGCTFKTVSVGIPLINTLYGTTSSPDIVALYTLPLLIWYPMQLIIGSIIAPYLAQYVDNELIRIEILSNNNNNNDSCNCTIITTTTSTTNGSSVATETTPLLIPYDKV